MANIILIVSFNTKKTCINISTIIEREEKDRKRVEKNAKKNESNGDGWSI